MEINYIDVEKIKFERTQGGLLNMEYEGQTYESVTLQRAFPVSKPWEYISVKAFAEHRDMSKEIGIIRDVRELLPEDRKQVEEELEQRYFVPIIKAVTSLKDEYGQVYMQIETNAGNKRIVAPNSTANFIMLGEDRLLIIDIDGNRYELPSLAAADKKTVRLLEVVI